MKKPKFGFGHRLKSSGQILRPFIVPVTLAVAALGLLGYKLLSLIPFAQPEQARMLGSATMSAIKNDVLFAPIKGLQIFILKVTDLDVYIRLASVAAALSAAVLLYVMLRKWYTVRVSLLTSIMFITSSWFLHQGRLANLDVLYLTTLPALLLASMLILSKRSDKTLPLAAILLGLTLYTPGTWVFIIYIFIVLRKIITKPFAVISKNTIIISAGVFILTLIPLVYSFALKPTQGLRWLGLDINQEFTARAIGSNFLEIPKQLFFSGPGDPIRWLTGSPVFDVMTLAMFVLGLYAYHTGYYASRQKLVFGTVIIAVLLIGLGNVVSLSLLIPVLYLVVANGLAYMLQSWFTVFPRNPVARSIGITLLILVVAGSCFYQLQRYYVAWPNADKTKQALTSER